MDETLDRHRRTSSPLPRMLRPSPHHRPPTIAVVWFTSHGGAAVGDRSAAAAALLISHHHPHRKSAAQIHQDPHLADTPSLCASPRQKRTPPRTNNLHTVAKNQIHNTLSIATDELQLSSAHSRHRRDQHSRRSDPPLVVVVVGGATCNGVCGGFEREWMCAE